MKENTLYYIYDPMCSWCWGFSSTYLKFIEGLDKSIKLTRLLGGLAKDSDEPMSTETIKMVKGAWSRIEKNIPGVKFNFDFWENNTPRRSTYMSCRAVIAAREQGLEHEVKMIQAIQQAYYQQAKNPSDINVLQQLAIDIGLSSQLFNQSLLSAQTEVIFVGEMQLARSLKVDSYPSLVLKQGNSLWPIPLDYNDEKPMLEMLEVLLADEF